MIENIEQYDWTITEERKAQLDVDNKRLQLSHSLTLHRDKQSIGDLQQMLDALISAGAPKSATIDVTARDLNGDKAHFGHMRVHAKWNQEATSD